MDKRCIQYHYDMLCEQQIVCYNDNLLKLLIQVGNILQCYFPIHPTYIQNHDSNLHRWHLCDHLKLYHQDSPYRITKFHDYLSNQLSLDQFHNHGKDLEQNGSYFLALRSHLHEFHYRRKLLLHSHLKLHYRKF